MKTALEFARETLAQQAANRGASDTAERYRSGQWDDSGEIKSAVLVAQSVIDAHSDARLTLSRSAIFIKVLLDYLDTDAESVNIQVKAGGEEKARIELADVLADIYRVIK